MVSDALQPLVGHSWGGCGDIAFFTIGAYRNISDKLKIFSYIYLAFIHLFLTFEPLFSVSMTDSTDDKDFTACLNDYNKELRAPFKQWANKVLPGLS